MQRVHHILENVTQAWRSIEPTHGFVFTCTAAWVRFYISMCELRFEFYSRWDWARSVQDLVVKPEAMSVWSLTKQTSLVLLKWTFKCYRSVMCRTWSINAIWSLKSDFEQQFDLFHIELQQYKSTDANQSGSEDLNI